MLARFTDLMEPNNKYNNLSGQAFSKKKNSLVNICGAFADYFFFFEQIKIEMLIF